MGTPMTTKNALIMSAATIGLFALSPAPLRAADDGAPATTEVAGAESIQLSIVLAKGGG